MGSKIFSSAQRLHRLTPPDWLHFLALGGARGAGFHCSCSGRAVPVIEKARSCALTGVETRRTPLGGVLVMDTFDLAGPDTARNDAIAGKRSIRRSECCFGWFGMRCKNVGSLRTETMTESAAVTHPVGAYFDYVSGERVARTPGGD